jgi:hypothetical protein
MKKTIMLFFTVLTLVGVLSIGSLNSRPEGAPFPTSGGPAEGGATCAQSGCHNGPASNVNDRMTTNIPTEGYTPGTTYNVTVSFSGEGDKGFMFSAQNAGGTFKGTPISGTGSKVTSTNYITHSAAINNTAATWTFQWIAPATGTGDVNLYGAFAVTRSNTTKQVITVKEKVNTGINEIAKEIALTSYVNNNEKSLNVAFNLKQQGHVKLTLVNNNGQVCEELHSGDLTSGAQQYSASTQHLKAGVYFIKVQVGNQSYFQKVLITN